jgi:penicillin G amidase
VIDEWTPVDSMIWAEMMIFDQSDKMKTELANIAQLAAVGQAMYDDLHPAYREERPTIIQAEDLPALPQSKSVSRTSLSQAEVDSLLDLSRDANSIAFVPPMLPNLGFGGVGASNSFAVSGSRTTTGNPLLANDPHMAISMPSLWYEIGLHCVEKTPECVFNLRGFSLPGVPVILIGHNDRIAWGLTNANFDAEDVFIERINPANPNQYEVNGGWQDMDLRREEIWVYGREEPVVIYVRSTRNGVVGSDEITDQQPFSYGEKGPQPYALSYAWTGLQPTRSLRSILMVNRAQNWQEFNDALEYFDTGKQNWLYADVDGNIGYVMPGKVPVRAKGDGTLPVPGWNDDFRWTGFIPYAELPRVFNPKQGFIATANNRQLREDEYPYLLNKETDYGQRAARVTQLIQNDLDKISLADMQATQTDNLSLPALEFIPYLENLTFNDPEVTFARDNLLGWDGQMLMTSPQAALYSIFWNELVAGIFHDQLPEDQWPIGNHKTEDIVYHLMQNPDNDWWDDLATPDVKERREAILKRAFEKAYQAGVMQFGENIAEWRWGDLHTIYYQNATLGKSGISLIENIFNRGPFPLNGSESVVQKTCWSTTLDYTAYCIPALRQVVDLGNLSNSQMVHSVGQSGHPVSVHYDDFIEAWRTFQYHPSNWLRSEAEAGKHDMLTLRP